MSAAASEQRQTSALDAAAALLAGDGDVINAVPGDVPQAAGKKRRGASRGDGAATPDSDSGGEMSRTPRGMGYDISEMNRHYSLVLLGSKAVVYVERPDAPLEDQKRFLILDAFRAWLGNTFTEIHGADGKIKVISWANAWLASPKRRSYSGVEFYPCSPGESATNGYLNLWSGFAVEPREKKHGWSVFQDHLLNNICDGNKDHFRWVFGYFAHMVQKPRERMGVALVLRGKMGTGKTKMGEVFGSLMPQHFFLVDDPRYVTGQFNAHMASCLLLQADEAVWAGDKAAEGRLKGLVTSSIQQIESKGVDPIRLKNYLRIVMTSNEDWVVPAGKDERRFCVLDVNPRCAQNTDYFSEMDEQLANGGLPALLHDLMAFDLASVNLRQIPRTDALLEQKLRSLDPVESWWFTRLTEGATKRNGSEWETVVSKSALVDDYLADAERVGIKRRGSESEIAMKLRKLVPDLRDRKMWLDDGGGQVRRWCWILPDLETCREAFSEAVQQHVAWPIADPERAGKEG